MVDRTLQHLVAHQHDRVAGAAPAAVARPQRHGRHDRAVGELVELAAQHLQLALAVGLGQLDQHRVAERLGRAHDLLGQLGEIARAELGHDERDQPRTGRAKAARRRVGHVAERLHGSQDALARLRADVGVVVDHVGDRALGDPRGASHVVHADGHQRRALPEVVAMALIVVSATGRSHRLFADPNAS
ncbi:hypothetical protein WBK31_36765 [Nonomuraea sp. N2-4H]